MSELIYILLTKLKDREYLEYGFYPVSKSGSSFNFIMIMINGNYRCQIKWSQCNYAITAAV